TLGVRSAFSPSGALDAPRFEWTNAVDFARRAVIRNVECDGGHGQVGIAPQIVVGQDNVPQVLAVGGGEPAAPVVGGEAELAAAARRLQTGRHIGAEAHTTGAEPDSRGILLLSGAYRAAVGARATVNPVIQSPLQAVDHLLDIGEVEARVQHALPVRLAIA